MSKTTPQVVGEWEPSQFDQQEDFFLTGLRNVIMGMVVPIGGGRVAAHWPESDLGEFDSLEEAKKAVEIAVDNFLNTQRGLHHMTRAELHEALDVLETIHNDRDDSMEMRQVEKLLLKYKRL